MSDDLKQELHWIFSSLRNDCNEFGNEFRAFVETHGQIALDLMQELATSGDVDNYYLCYAYEELGWIEHPDTYEARLALLLEGAKSADGRIRYASYHGLVDTNDPRALNALKEALTRTSDNFTKSTLESCIQYLEKKLKK
jgi:hypothetical protein